MEAIFLSFISLGIALIARAVYIHGNKITTCEEKLNHLVTKLEFFEGLQEVKDLIKDKK